MNRAADMKIATKAAALMKFLARLAKRLGVGSHTYVVGGAVRNHLMGLPPKDIDVVIDSVALKGKDSEWFAKEIQSAIPVRTNLTTNQYGVAILTLAEPWLVEPSFTLPKGETIEIANARKESYSGDAAGPGKGYKPHMVEPATIEEDTLRREFSVNTLLWRLIDLEEGPEHAQALDPTGRGLEDLKERVLRTPQAPDKTFADDPTRMLRAVKFVAKYGFKIAPEVEESIRRNAAQLKKMPWDAVRKILTDDILDGAYPQKSVALMKELGLADVLKEMLHENPGFASALGRYFTSQSWDVGVVLDLLDLGWTVRTPLSFLDRAGQARLREILFGHADEPTFEVTFVTGLIKPPVDQQRFFTDFAIPPKERQVVVQVARKLLLDEPQLLGSGLADAVEAELGKRFDRTSLPERVARKFVLGSS
jgi:tRNA nucleotidyltransferase/poly(A) polymerase